MTLRLEKLCFVLMLNVFECRNEKIYKEKDDRIRKEQSTYQSCGKASASQLDEGR